MSLAARTIKEQNGTEKVQENLLLYARQERTIFTLRRPFFARSIRSLRNRVETYLVHLQYSNYGKK